ncbi:MAG: laccase domain-containing protein [Candidatus Eisenbacteria bacterium]|nr:laccase domain-containing protein [Candidatus Eisenbacteria bacterium]
MNYSWRPVELLNGIRAFALAPEGSARESGPANSAAGAEHTALESPGLVTTRRGGVSKGPFESLNVSFRVGDDPASVKENRALIAGSLGLDQGACARPEQVHGNLVLRADGPGDRARADGLVSASGDVWLSVHVADCVPVFVFSPDLRRTGLAHAGRKGTAAGVTTNLLNMFKSAFRCDVSQLIVALGPSVGPCCYELDSHTASHLRRECVAQRRGRFFFDLWKANGLQALEAGVREENVVMPPACTSCKADLFFSHRAHKGTTGRQMAITRSGGLRLKGASVRENGRRD